MLSCLANAGRFLRAGVYAVIAASGTVRAGDQATLRSTDGRALRYPEEVQVGAANRLLPVQVGCVCRKSETITDQRSRSGNPYAIQARSRFAVA